MELYNYNLQKDIKSLKTKIDRLIEVYPYMNKAKKKIIQVKLRELEKQIKFLQR